jgi:hypothetical protein
MLNITNTYSTYHNKAGIYMISAKIFSPTKVKLRKPKFIGDATQSSVHEGVFQTKTYIGQSENLGQRLSDHMTELKNGSEKYVKITGFANSYKTNNNYISVYLLEDVTEFIKIHNPLLSQSELLNTFESYYVSTKSCNNKEQNTNINFLIKNFDYLQSKGYNFIPSCNLQNSNNVYQIVYKTPSFEQLHLSSRINKDCVFNIPIFNIFNTIPDFKESISYYSDKDMDINLCNSYIYVNFKDDNTLHQNPLLCNVNFRDGLYCGLTIEDMTGSKRLRHVSISQATIAIKYKKKLNRKNEKRMINQQILFPSALGKNDTRSKFVDLDLINNDLKFTAI